MVSCITCNRYMRSSVEIEKELCQWCIDAGYSKCEETGRIRYPPIDDTPLSREIEQEILDALDESDEV